MTNKRTANIIYFNTENWNKFVVCLRRIIPNVPIHADEDEVIILSHDKHKPALRGIVKLSSINKAEKEIKEMK